MNGLVAAPLQFGTDRRFAGAGNAFNQVISPAHGSHPSHRRLFMRASIPESHAAVSADFFQVL
jgi:hypothetical protein